MPLSDIAHATIYIDIFIVWSRIDNYLSFLLCVALGSLTLREVWEEQCIYYCYYFFLIFYSYFENTSILN